MTDGQNIWSEKYRPQNLLEVENLEKEKAQLINFIKNYDKIRDNVKALILSGSPGTGKTALVYATAKQLGYEVIELNASDCRDKKAIDEIIGRALGQKSLIAKNKVILIDELEGISGQEDRGGLAELQRLMQTSYYPIVMTTNNVYDPKLKELRKNAVVVEINKLHFDAIVRILKRIAKKENLEVSDEAIRLIARHAQGDARAAINDLQTLAGKNKKILLAEVTDFLSLASRDKEQKIFDALALLFHSTILHVDIFENVDMELDEIIRWVEENIPEEYEGKALAVAYDLLALADLFLHRIVSQQYWRYLVYANLFLCLIGPACNAIDKKKRRFVKYRYPSAFIALYERKKAREKEIIESLSKAMHCSKRKLRNELPWIKFLLE
jgi:replication factor C large subunit